MEGNILEVVLKIGLLALEVAAALVATYLVPKLPQATASFLTWSKNKAAGVKNAYAAGVLQRLIDLVGQKVLMVENTIIEDLKEAAKDNKITKEEMKACLAKAKQTVLDSVKADASAQGLWKLALEIFLDNESALGKWLDDALEATVAKLAPSGLQTSKDGVTPPAAAKLVGAPSVP